MKRYNDYSNGWFCPVIPANEVVKVAIRDFDNSLSYIDIPVTQDILSDSGPTREGSYHYVNLRLLGGKVPACKSYFLAD